MANATSVSEYAERSRSTPGKVPCKTPFVKTCHCEKRLSLSRRGNPPEGYLAKRAPKCGDCVSGPVEELPMKTRLDGSAFRRSNIVCGGQPSQPQARGDVPLLATPRHPRYCFLTVCNRFAYFTIAYFGGRSFNVNIKSNANIFMIVCSIVIRFISAYIKVSSAEPLFLWRTP